jgi:hypothetical protein
MLKQACKIRMGDHVLHTSGEWIKVVASFLDPLSGPSGSVSCWFIEGYVDGSPTRRLISAEDYEHEVRP